MGIVKVENIKLYAYHGCLEEEALIGSDYRVDLQVNANLQKAANSDLLEDTVDYVHLNRIVKEEMLIRSKLLEHVAQRILNRVFRELPSVEEGEIAISKITPPIGGDVEAVTVMLHKKRS